VKEHTYLLPSPILTILSRANICMCTQNYFILSVDGSSALTVQNTFPVFFRASWNIINNNILSENELSKRHVKRFWNRCILIYHHTFVLFILLFSVKIPNCILDMIFFSWILRDGAIFGVTSLDSARIQLELGIHW